MGIAAQNGIGLLSRRHVTWVSLQHSACYQLRVCVSVAKFLDRRGGRGAEQSSVLAARVPAQFLKKVVSLRVAKGCMDCVG